MRGDGHSRRSHARGADRDEANSRLGQTTRPGASAPSRSRAHQHKDRAGACEATDASTAPLRVVHRVAVESAAPVAQQLGVAQVDAIRTLLGSEAVV
ncbi:MAG: hypothetical protein ACRDLL_01655 [Solirubrobacterales bacterium]